MGWSTEELAVKRIKASPGRAGTSLPYHCLSPARARVHTVRQFGRQVMLGSFPSCRPLLPIRSVCMRSGEPAGSVTEAKFGDPPTSEAEAAGIPVVFRRISPRLSGGVDERLQLQAQRIPNSTPSHMDKLPM